MESRVVATMGSTRTSVTKGFEENAKDNYTYIRALANHAAKKFKITMDDVVSFMTATRDPGRGGIMIGLRAGSFNNYCRTGVVSEFTVNKLYHFFDKQISVEILRGRKLLREEPDSIVLIFAIMMDKLYRSSITSIHLDGTSKVKGALRYHSLNDYVKVLINDIKESLFSFPDEQDIDLSEINEIEQVIEKVNIDIVNSEDFNSYIANYGLEPYIHENEKFISLVSYDTLYDFDLSILIKCRDDYKTLMDIFDSVIKFKEAKKRQTQTI